MMLMWGTFNSRQATAFENVHVRHGSLCTYNMCQAYIHGERGVSLRLSLSEHFYDWNQHPGSGKQTENEGPAHNTKDAGMQLRAATSSPASFQSCASRLAFQCQELLRGGNNRCTTKLRMQKQISIQKYTTGMCPQHACWLHQNVPPEIVQRNKTLASSQRKRQQKAMGSAPAQHKTTKCLIKKIIKNLKAMHGS